MKFILGKKIEMTQIWRQSGEVIPVTLIEAGPCRITQVKTEAQDGYNALQLGFEKKEKGVKKTEKGKEFRYLKEWVSDETDLKLGDEIKVSIFQPGDKVKVSGISKGKGFQGAVKRWGFSGGCASHGNKHEHRTLGSVGGAWPQRVVKGRKMPGRTGGQKVLVGNLEIIEVDKTSNLLAVKGAVPGCRGTLLEIRSD